MAKPERSARKTRTLLDVEYPRKPNEEAAQFLSEGQQVELDDVIRERLPEFPSSSRLWDLEIVRVGRIWRLTHSGASFGDIVARVYFGYCPERHKIYVCGVLEGHATDEPWYRVQTMENRFDHYRRIDK